MASFTPNKIVISEINGGNKYKNGDGVTADAINAPIEAALYAQSIATNPPIYDENGGNPTVDIITDIYGARLMFSNLKGQKGEQGTQGIQGIQGVKGETGNGVTSVELVGMESGGYVFRQYYATPLSNGSNFVEFTLPFVSTTIKKTMVSFDVTAETDTEVFTFTADIAVFGDLPYGWETLDIEEMLSLPAFIGTHTFIPEINEEDAALGVLFSNGEGVIRISLMLSDGRVFSTEGVSISYVEHRTIVE